MPTKEVICISSDDESDPKKVKKPSDDSTKKDKTKKSQKFKKRKASTDLVSPKPKKRIQPMMLSKLKRRETRSTSDDGIEVLQVVPSPSCEPSTSGVSYTNKSKSTVELIDEHLASASTFESPQPNGKSVNDSDAYFETSSGNKRAKFTEAPQLIIKEKRPVESDTVGHEVFVQFLSQCLSRDRSPQMEKILQKLKRHYEQLDPEYAHSPAFVNLLNEKRECLLSGDSYLYVHISDVDKEMKCRKWSTPQPKAEEPKEEIEEEVVGEYDKLDPKINAKVKKILAVMDKCQERIKRLEEAEVDWSDEDNSNYLKVSKYKERMAQLYYKYCELTGEHEDAGRPYLRPKCLKVTKIVSVDQAIISFINKKLTDKVKKFKKGLSAADCVIFPDYCDILNCIRECNKAQKLGMDKKGEEALARKAFKDLGEYLQIARQRDFFDTFSLMYENKKDPALENPELLEKLNQNKAEGKKKLNAVFEEFVKKQEAGLSKSSENGSDDDNKQDNRDEDNSEEEEDEGAENDDDDVDDISLQESEISVTLEDESMEAIPTHSSNNSLEKTHGNKSAFLKNEVSDTQETIVTEHPVKVKKPYRVVYEADDVLVNTNRIVAISDGTIESISSNSSRVTFPIDGPTCQGNRVVLEDEGTVTLAKNEVQYEKILEKASSDKKSNKPGPQSSKTVVKPSIRNIQNVRVVIKGNDIVKINGSISQVKDSDIKSQLATELQETSTENSLAGFLDSNKTINTKIKLPSQNSSADISEKSTTSSIRILGKENKLLTVEDPKDVTIIDEKSLCIEPSTSKVPETAHQSEAKCNLAFEEPILFEKMEESGVKSIASASSTVDSVESVAIVEHAVKQVQSMQSSTSKVEKLDEKNSLVTLETSLSSLNKINLKSSKVKSKTTFTVPKNTSNANSSVRSQNSSGSEMKISAMSERHEIPKLTKEDTQNGGNGDERSSTKQLSIEETIISGEKPKMAKNLSSQSSTQARKVVDKDKEVVDEKSEREIGEERPVLKVRSFAKPPDSWKSSQENPTQTLKKRTPTSTPKPIEIVDLDDENDQTNTLTPILTTLQKNELDATGNKSSYGDVHIVINVPRDTSPKTKIDINLKRSPIETSNIATIATGVTSSLPSSTSSSVSQLPQSIQTNVHSDSTCTPTGRIIGKVRPMKGRVIAVDKAIIVPLGTSLSSNRVLTTTQTQVNQQKTRTHLIHNTAGGSSSILKTPNKSVYVNPVNQKVLNPLSRQSVIQKPVNNGQLENNKINISNSTRFQKNVYDTTRSQNMSHIT